MDLRLLEKSAHVAPFLLRLHDSHKLYQQAKENRPEAMKALTGAVVDLLSQKLEGREQDLLTDVVAGLMRQAETDLRQALAQRMATMPDVPLQLILNLVNDDIMIAAPVLRKSPVLNDLDLIYIIKSRGADYWHAIAARENLSPDIINMLADKRDAGTAIVLSENQRIRLTGHAMEILAEMAEQSEAIARPLLMRKELPSAFAERLYDHVGQELKNYIKTFFDYMPDELAFVVEDSIFGIADSDMDLVLEQPQAPAVDDEYLPGEGAMVAARQLAESGQLNLNLIVQTLGQGKIPMFIAMMAVFSGLPAREVVSIMAQPSARKLALICRAHDIFKSDFARMYLLTNRMRSESKLVNHSDMLAALAYFDKLRPDDARRILAQLSVN